MRLAINEEAAEALGEAINFTLFENGCVYRLVPNPPKKYNPDTISLVFDQIHDQYMGCSDFIQAANQAYRLKQIGSFKKLLEKRGPVWAEVCREKMSFDNIKETDSVLEYFAATGEVTVIEWLRHELKLNELHQVLLNVFSADTDTLLRRLDCFTKMKKLTPQRDCYY